MKLLRQVVSVLEVVEIPHALIGATALAIHGVSRATADIDLLTVDHRALDQQVWKPLVDQGTSLRILKGGSDDPLAGSVRLQQPEEVVDVVVGCFVWQREVLEMAIARPFADLALHVVEPAGLVLLKLHAGSPKDAWDIQALLEISDDRSAIATEVERTLPRLPADARALWRRIRK